MPRNGKTGDRYAGINILILWDAVVANGFSTNSFLTFRQALALGGNVRKGERGTTVVYDHSLTPDSERRRGSEDGREPGAIPFLWVERGAGNGWVRTGGSRWWSVPYN